MTETHVALPCPRLECVDSVLAGVRCTSEWLVVLEHTGVVVVVAVDDDTSFNDFVNDFTRLFNERLFLKLRAVQPACSTPCSPVDGG
jgi:hypothetical protein